MISVVYVFTKLTSDAKMTFTAGGPGEQVVYLLFSNFLFAFHSGKLAASHQRALRKEKERDDVY